METLTHKELVEFVTKVAQQLGELRDDVTHVQGTVTDMKNDLYFNFSLDSERLDRAMLDVLGCIKSINAIREALDSLEEVAK